MLLSSVRWQCIIIRSGGMARECGHGNNRIVGVVQEQSYYLLSFCYFSPALTIKFCTEINTKLSPEV